MSVHPEVQAYIDMAEKSPTPPYHKLTPQEVRVVYHKKRKAMEPVSPEIGLVQNLVATDGPNGPVPLRLYRPLNSKSETILPAMIYFHGGGMMIGDLDTHDTLCREFSNYSGCCVISVDYRLAPENRFPKAVEDSWAAVQWIYKNARELKINPDRLAVGGDSAGGTLAAVVSLMARDQGSPKLFFQLLIYPATNQNLNTPSYETMAQGYVLTIDTVNYFRSHYIDEKDYSNWWASPALAKDFKGVAPALVVTAAYDPLVDEGRDYAELLKNAGVEVKYKCYEDMIHGFIRLGGIISPANKAVKELAEELKARAFGK